MMIMASHCVVIISCWMRDRYATLMRDKKRIEKDGAAAKIGKKERKKRIQLHVRACVDDGAVLIFNERVDNDDDSISSALVDPAGLHNKCRIYRCVRTSSQTDTICIHSTVGGV
jgi:hypothetical protein